MRELQENRENRVQLEAAVRSALGGMSLAYDQMVAQQGGVYLRNVLISGNGVVITADDAFIQNGEIRLGANARVRFSPK
jgi:hypothetical protein